MERKYQYSFGELLDRLSIIALKHQNNKELRAQYAEEIDSIVQDLNYLMTNKPGGFHVTGEFLWALIVLTHFNQKIWNNEDNARKGDPENNELFKTHVWNGVRRRCMDKLAKSMGHRADPKVNALSELQLEDEPHWP